MTLHGMFSYEASDVVLIILHSRESRMVGLWGSLKCVRGKEATRDQFLGELDLAGGESGGRGFG